MSQHGVSDWARGGDVPVAEVPFRTTDAEAQIVAEPQGLGMATLSCFVGDADPLLARGPAPPCTCNGTLWLLTQGETRKTKRVRLFTEFLSHRLAAHVELLAGHPTPATDERHHYDCSNPDHGWRSPPRSGMECCGYGGYGDTLPIPLSDRRPP